MKIKQLIVIITINIIITGAAFLVLGNYILRKLQFAEKESPVTVRTVKFNNVNNGMEGFEECPGDLTVAAKTALAAVVQVKAKFPSQKKDTSRSGADDFFEDVLGRDLGPGMTPEQRASGSGVVISDDGYIITNAHVITSEKGAVVPEVTVTLRNRKMYKAKIIGHDRITDLAVLKIEAKHLSYLLYTDAAMVEPGEWVVAAGYPLSLQATATAGIVSAMGRKIDANRNVVSFIQTDAAVNYGNSGGALVNAKGELIGITSFIFSTNQSYAGYSFAVPVSVAKKVANEIIKYGKVQSSSSGR